MSVACVPRSTMRPSSQDDDLTRVAHGAHAMRRDHRRAPGERAAQPAQDLRLRVRVHGGERVVEQHDARPARERARQREPLLLSAGQVDPALAEHGAVSVRELAHRLVELRDLGGPAMRRRVALAGVARLLARALVDASCSTSGCVASP